MKRKTLLGVSISLMFMISILLIALPSVVADHEVVIEKTIEIKGSQGANKKIETSGGLVNYSWRIINYNNDSIAFSIIRTDDNFLEDEIIGNQSKYSNKKKLGEGEYVFEWRNRNKNRSFNLSYSITYLKELFEEGKGCYSSTISLVIILIAVIILTYGFNSKNIGRL
jgi:hypothetical protein